MSRLKKLQRKHFMLKAFLLTILFISLVIFIITIGLKLLLNTSILISHLTRNNSDQTTKQNTHTIRTNIAVEEIPTATNSAEIFISGTATAFDKITFYLNNNPVKTIKPKNQTFVEKIGYLNEGENEIYVLGEQQSKKTKQKTKTYTVLYKKTKPKLEIAEPENQSTVTEQEITIKGKTDQDVSLKINNYPVVVMSEGSFETSVRLSEGENTITIEVQDNAGNKEKKQITVNYSPEE